MSDMADIYREMREAKQAANAERLTAAQSLFFGSGAGDLSIGWTQHTAYYWSRSLKGERLDFWPSSGKWRWRGKSYRGDSKAAMAFISKVEAR